MAKRFYSEVTAGTDLGIFDDPPIYNKTTDETLLALVVEQQALSDNIRTLLAACGGRSLEEYDAYLEDRFDELSERIDYYDYTTIVKNITVMDGAWYTPDSVHSFCGETGTDVVGNSIDGANNTVWKHSVNERHSVIYKLRDYPKKISKIRFRYNASEPVIERLSNLDVHAAKHPANLDDPENILETGINIIWPTGQGATWVEHTLATKKNRATYIKLLFDTAHANNTSQVREFDVWVETRDPEVGLL